MLDFRQNSTRLLVPLVLGGGIWLLKDEIMLALRKVSRHTIVATDGHRTQALLGLPSGPGPHPTVVLMHGGVGDNYAQTRAGLLDWRSADLLHRGYAVFAADFRRHAFGGDEHLDIQAALEFVRSHPEIDADRLAYVGASHGGYLALMAARKTTPRAVVTYSTGSNLVGVVEPAGGPIPLLTSSLINEFKRDLSSLWKLKGNGSDYTSFLSDRSPIAHASEITCPVLLLHGASDTLVAPEESTNMAAAVQSAGGHAEVHLYPGIGHELVFLQDETGEDAYRRLEEFLAQHLGSPLAHEEASPSIFDLIPSIVRRAWSQESAPTPV